MKPNHLDPPIQFKQERKNNWMNPNPSHGFTICFISSYPPNRARLSEYAYNFVKGLKDRPIVRRIYVLSDKSSDPKVNDVVDKKVKVSRIWSADDPLSILKISIHTLKLKPDIVHLNIHFQSFGRGRISNFIGFSLILILKLLRKRVLVTAHNLGEKVDLEKVGVKPTLLNRIGIMLATRMLLLADCVVVTVKAYVQHLRERYSCQNVLFISHGSAPRPLLNADPPDRRILMFGHMSPYKGLPVLLRAFRDLLRERDDVRLIIAGASHPNFPCYLEKLAHHLPKNADIMGYVPEEKLAELFSSCDLVVLPYLTATGTSGVFHLACGYGKPVVASYLPEIRDMVEEGASAILVPPEEAYDLKKAISLVLDDQYLRDEMSRRNFGFAGRESWSKVAETYERAYLKVMNV